MRRNALLALACCALAPAAHAQRPASRDAHPLEASARESRSAQEAKQLSGNGLAGTHHLAGFSESNKAHSDLRIPRAPKAAALPALRPRVAVTPSGATETAIGEVAPDSAGTPALLAASPAVVGGRSPVPWLLLPLGVGVVALGTRHHGHGATPADSTPPVVVPADTPRTTTPEPASFLLLLPGLATAGWTYTKRRT